MSGITHYLNRLPFKCFFQVIICLLYFTSQHHFCFQKKCFKY